MFVTTGTVANGYAGCGVLQNATIASCLLHLRRIELLHASCMPIEHCDAEQVLTLLSCACRGATLLSFAIAGLSAMLSALCYCEPCLALCHDASCMAHAADGRAMLNPCCAPTLRPVGIRS